MTDEQLADVVEELLHVGPAPSRFLRYLDLPGVRASVGPGPEREHNRVGVATLRPDDADAAIERVRATFSKLGHAFTWYLTPGSRPADLAARLVRAGLVEMPDAALAGLVRTDLATVEAPAEVVDATVDDLHGHVAMLAAAHGVPEAQMRGSLDLLAAGGLPGRSFRSYFAVCDGEPVAYATSMLDRPNGVLLLGGAATLPSHRGRGLYRALVEARVADARALGCRAVVVQARRTTSAPVLLRLGFREVVPITAYAGP